MRLRYVLARIGIDANKAEIAEAVELCGMWQEERAGLMCPFMGAT
ncbi:MAG: hypothetical protein PHY48_12785 [Candidatus Cloacimonetes bacterium]|nr:hypothetical protein [Candidatus Cloacimonadota bacterium]